MMRENKPIRLNIPLPKEHGSWAMFAVPLIIGCAVAAQWQWRTIGLIAAEKPLDEVEKIIENLQANNGDMQSAASFIQEIILTNENKKDALFYTSKCSFVHRAE